MTNLTFANPVIRHGDSCERQWQLLVARWDLVDKQVSTRVVASLQYNEAYLSTVTSTLQLAA